jgi:hypothetical protein
MKNKYEGIATIELTDIETGQVERIEEHNNLTCLLDDIYKNGNLDSVLSIDYTMKKYLSKLVVLDGIPRNSKAVIDDDINILAVKSASSVSTYDETGLEMIFDFSKDEAVGEINCVCLAPECFQDYTLNNHSNSNLVKGTSKWYSGDLNASLRILDMDFDNNFIWTIEADDFKNLNSNSDFNVYVRKYYHNFKEMPFVIFDGLGLKLLESTALNVSSMLVNCGGANSNRFLNYAYDEKNKKIYIIFINNEMKEFNVCKFSRDNTADVIMRNMILPAEITSKMYYTYWGRMTQMPFYNGRICLYSTIADAEEVRTGYIGINPMNTTDYIEYEMNYLKTMAEDKSEYQVIGMNNGTTICNNVMFKNGMATVGNFTEGFFYKSKLIKAYQANTQAAFDFNICNQVISTINEMTKTIIKTDKKTLRITYRIKQKGVR